MDAHVDVCRYADCIGAERMCAVARSTLMVLEHLPVVTAPAGSTAPKEATPGEGSDVEGSDDKEAERSFQEPHRCVFGQL